MVLYPSKTDILISFNNFAVLTKVDSLKPAKFKRGTTQLLHYSGGFAQVFVAELAGKLYAIKCWSADVGEDEIRYGHICEYLTKKQLPYFVEFEFYCRAISINGTLWPLLKMEWVPTGKLKKYLDDFHHNSRRLSALASNFLDMVMVLHKNEIAHCDLQHGNIMVDDLGNIKLIDYDSMYVPKLSGYSQTTCGLDCYQHPKRREQKALGPNFDYFSELVIYLTIVAIRENPDHWDNIEEEELLFSKDDFINFSSRPIYNKLMALSPFVQHLTYALDQSTQLQFSQLVPLETIVASYNTAYSHLLPRPYKPIVLTQTQRVPYQKPTKKKNHIALVLAIILIVSVIAYIKYGPIVFTPKYESVTEDSKALTTDPKAEITSSDIPGKYSGTMEETGQNICYLEVKPTGEIKNSNEIFSISLQKDIGTDAVTSLIGIESSIKYIYSSELGAGQISRNDNGQIVLESSLDNSKKWRFSKIN